MPELDPLTVADVLSAVRGDPSELAARRLRGSPRLERAAYPEQGPGEGDAAVWSRVLQDPWGALGGVTNQLTGVNQERYQVGPERALRAPGKAMAGGYGQPLSEEFVEASLPDAQRMAGLAAVGGAPRSSVGSGGARPAAAVGEPHAFPPAPSEPQRILSQLLTPVEVPRYEGPASRANPGWAFLGENTYSNRWNRGGGSFPLLTPTGNPRRLGNLDVTMRDGEPHVDMIGRDTSSSWRRRLRDLPAEGGLEVELKNISGAGALGTTGTKGLLMGVRRQFPEAGEVEGFRVSGGRAAARRSGDAGARIPRFSPEVMEAYEDARARALGWRPRLDAAEEKISRAASELRSQALEEPPPDWNFTGRVGEPEPAGGAAPRATSASGGTGAGHLNAEGLRYYAGLIARRDRATGGGLPFEEEQAYRAYTDLRNGRMPRNVDDVDFAHVRADNGGPAARAGREVPWTGGDAERMGDLARRASRTAGEEAELGSLRERQRVARGGGSLEQEVAGLAAGPPGRGRYEELADRRRGYGARALTADEEAEFRRLHDERSPRTNPPPSHEELVRGGGITQEAVDAERARAARETAPRTERWEQVGREYNEWLRQNDLPNMSMDELGAEIAPQTRRGARDTGRAQQIRDQLAEFRRRWEASDWDRTPDSLGQPGHGPRGEAAAWEGAAPEGTNYIPREAPPAVTPEHVMDMPAGRGERQALDLARRYDITREIIGRSGTRDRLESDPQALWRRYNELYGASDRPGFTAQQEFHDLHDFFFGTGSRTGPVRAESGPPRLAPEAQARADRYAELRRRAGDESDDRPLSAEMQREMYALERERAQRYVELDRRGVGNLSRSELAEFHELDANPPSTSHEQVAARRPLSDLRLADIHAALERAGYDEDIGQFSDLRYEGPHRSAVNRREEHRYSYEFESEDGPERGYLYVWRGPDGRLAAEYGGTDRGH